MRIKEKIVSLRKHKHELRSLWCTSTHGIFKTFHDHNQCGY